MKLSTSWTPSAELRPLWGTQLSTRRVGLMAANAQPAVGVYSWDDERQTHLPFALDVLTLEGDRIKEVTAFIVRTIEPPEASFRRWPAQRTDSDRVRSVFERFGLPPRLD